jgi:integrase/recombinase XerD
VKGVFTTQFYFMATTTSLFINRHSPNAKDKCSVSIRVTFERKKKYYPTGLKLTVSDFEKTQSKKPRKAFKELALKMHSFEKKAADIIKDLPVFTFKAFEKHYYSNRGAKDSINLAFADYAAELRQAGRIGTAVSYECSQSSLNKFAPGAKFADVAPDFLRKYEKWMLSKEKSITTVGIYLRSLRTLFNNAIADGMLTKDYYPFGKKRYEIPTGNNIKKALTLNDIAKIYYYQPEPGSMTERAKDYWLFMYLCNGINVKDMCLLKYENIKGEILEFERAKTARTKRNVEPIRVALSEDAKAIIKKWGNENKDSKTFIFPVLEKGLTPERERQLIQQLTQVINCHMKGIVKNLEITNDVTTYAARHSFATILQRSGVSTEFISEALGHSNVRTTQNYLAGFEDESKRETVKLLTAFKHHLQVQTN